MAYSDVYRSPSQSSGYTVSAIDGVEIKISEKLIPPPAVTKPVEYDTGNPSEILFMEYDFSLEERVIEWSKSQRENVEALQKAETERVGEQIQQFSQMPDPQPPPSQQTQNESNPSQPTPNPVQAAASDTPNVTTGWRGTGEDPSQARPNLNPFINIGSSILTPMPIHAGGQGHIRKGSGSNKVQTGMIDLKDFENEQDPFENMELKVLNDREELNKMIFDVQAMPDSQTGPVENGGANQAQESTSRSPTASSPVNLKDVDYPEVESFDSSQFAMPEQQNVPYTSNQPQGSVNLQTDANRVFYRSPHPTSSVPLSSQNMPGATYSYNQGVPLPPISNPSYFPQQPVSSNIQNFFGPTTTSTANVSGLPSQNSVNFTSAGAIYTKQLGDRNYIPFQIYNRNPNLDSQNGNSITNGQLNSQVSSRQGRETPPLNPLRSARSTPDISGSEDRRLPPLMPSSQTPPPIARSISPNEISSTHSPPRRKRGYSENQDSTWEHYNVLPPSPRSASTMADVQSPSCSNPGSKPVLPNPFGSLPPEARRLVESITDMGFPRARVARAVQKLGSDDKQVVDFLCLTNRLAEKGCDPENAETALILNESNFEKAEQYLKLLSRFKELGFAEKNIQDALLSTSLDENQTLDLLTAR